MNENNFDSNIPGAQELSEQQLMLIQGGNIFGDAIDWVKDKVSDAVDGLKDAVTHPGRTVLQIAGGVADAIQWFAKHYKPGPTYGR